MNAILVDGEHRSIGAAPTVVSLLAGLAIMHAGTACADASDPLWQQMRQRVGSMQGWVAGQVNYTVSQQNERGRSRYRAVERLVGWSGLQAQRELRAHHENPLQSMAEAKPPEELNPADHPDQVLLRIDEVQRLDAEPLDGQPAQVFAVRGHYDAQEFFGNSRRTRSVPLNGKVWVRDDGNPVRLSYRIEGLPLTREFRYEVDFAQGSSPQSVLPSQARLSVTVSMPFVGNVKLDRQLDLSDWQRNTSVSSVPVMMD